MEENDGFYDKYKFILFLIFGLILIVFIWWYGGNWLWEFWKLDQANLRGDAYGALNTLFSGLAFAGIIISILMQSEELKLQRKELKATRNEFREQKEIMKDSKFHDYFIFLMKHKDFLKDTITVELTDLNTTSSERIINKGEEAFYYWFREFEGSGKEEKKEVLRHMKLWHNTHKSKINEYLDFIKKMRLEIKKENNPKYNLFSNTIQSSNEKFVIQYLEEN